MQDFKQYDYTLTLDQLKKIYEENKDIIIIINGEYYELIERKQVNANDTK